MAAAAVFAKFVCNSVPQLGFKRGFFALNFLCSNISSSVNIHQHHHHHHHHQSKMSSASSTFIQIPENSDFTLSNIPFGIFSTAQDSNPRPATRIGNYVLDLALLSSKNILSKAISSSDNNDRIKTALQKSTLNEFASLGKSARATVRTAVLKLVQDGSEAKSGIESALVDVKDVKMHLPMEIGDYTDFYAGINHATNVGTLFRGKDNALQPNYLHLPVGYHGRASTVVVSDTPIRRPIGQTCPPTNATPNFGPCQRLDIELEMACFIARPNNMGEPIDINDAEDYIFGYALMNDWSARDIQAWEYVPLGPFNAKNFGTTVSPWIVTDEALEGYRAARRDRGELLPYLRDEKRAGKEVFDIKLEVLLKPSGGNDHINVFGTSSSELLYSFPQMLAHHTITGCGMRSGDLFGSGTISGNDSKSVGSFLEANQSGKEVIDLGNGVQRKWLEDGDEIVIKGHAGEGSSRVGFGECAGVILPAQLGRWQKVDGKKKE